MILLSLVLTLQVATLLVLIKKQVIEIHRSPSGSIGPFLNSKKPKKKPIAKSEFDLYNLENEKKHGTTR